MSTTDELLEEMLEDVEEYATPVTDDDLQFWIDEHLRVISIPKNGVVAGVEGDKNVNKIKFGMNRYYHGFDMSTFSGRILYSNAKGNKNYYNITDMQASGSAITFSWLVDADAVQYMGKTAFVVYLFKTQGSELRQKFYSTLATLKVLEGMEVDSAVPVEKQTDIIERMKEEISAYAEEVKKSLPADYTAMTEQVNSLKEDIENDFFAFGKTPVDLTSIGKVYFGYKHGDRPANDFEKFQFRTVIGKLYMIETTIQTNIPLFKCGNYYYPVSPISDTVKVVTVRGYFFGDGNILSINSISAKEKNVYACEVHGVSNIPGLINESNNTKSAITSINHNYMNDVFKNLVSKCICCGDSLTRGYYSASVPNEDGSLPTYPKELAKITGWACTNGGRSGYDAVQWYSERFKLFDFSDKDIAILFLGTNRGISSDYSSISDGSTTGSAYRKIIEGIHAQNPNCKIYTLSCFATTSTQNTLDEVNNNIQAISNLYNYTYFCDFKNNPYFDVMSDDVHNSETGIHFTPIGYKLMANAIYMLMVSSFTDNIADYDMPIN